MNCWNITETIRRARTVGIIIDLDEAGNLRLRAPNEPPQATVQHLREHKQELTEFLKAKAAAEDGERRLIASQQKRNVTPRRYVSKPQIGRAALEQAVPVVAATPSRDKR